MKSLTQTFALLILFVSSNLCSQNLLKVQDPDQWWSFYNETGNIREATISLEPKGAYTEVGLYLTISDEGVLAGVDNAEIILDFNLPKGSIIHDSWLWMPDGQIIVQADVYDISKAWQTYEDIVDRNRDPSILYRKGASNYQIRIFPLVPGEERKIKIAYLSPNDWDAEKIATWLPLEIIRTSVNQIDKVKIIHIPNSEWSNPRLEGISDKEFISAIDPVFGEIEIAELAGSDLALPITYEVDAPFANGNHYVGKLNDVNDNFYQLAYLPPMTAEVQTGKKAMLLLDIHNQNTNHDQETILSAVKKAMTKLDLAGNEFKCGYFNGQLNFLNDQWSSISPLNVENFVGYESGGENTYEILKAAISEAKLEDVPIDIVLLSSSDQIAYWSSESKAEELLEEIGTAPLSIHVIDVQTENFIVYDNWGEAQFLTTNHSAFYQKLANYTHGSYESMFEGGLNVWSICENIFESQFYKPQQYDLHVKMDQGFSYSRHQVTDKLVNPNKPIVQVGKYLGEFPMEIEFSGQDINGFVYEEDWISESTVSTSDTLLREMWVGNEISFLEGQVNSGSDIQEIVNMSIEERVLSEHTAFLALDLENGGEFCANCWEVGSDIFISTTNKNEYDISVEAYPNPFIDFVKIEVSFEENIEGDLSEVAIYDLLGKRIKLFSEVVASEDNKYIFTWNGQDENGAKLTSGIYLFSINNGKRNYIHKLSLLGK